MSAVGFLRNVVQKTHTSPSCSRLSSSLIPGDAPSQARTSALLRSLLRETAQPVAVITAFMPEPSSSSNGVVKERTPKFHGATLSSFTSISMHPHPLVSFALRIPSRMATALKRPSHTSENEDEDHPHMVINLLSSTQPSLAQTFSRPHSTYDPFQDPLIPHTLSAEGLPILSGSLGALTCVVVRIIELDALFPHSDQSHANLPVDASSELFIARVVRVEESCGGGAGEEDDDRGRLGDGVLPLVYYQRGYTSPKIKG